MTAGLLRLRFPDNTMFRSSVFGALGCQNGPGFGTYALDWRSVAAKSVFCFHHVGEKFVGLSGRASFAPPQAARVTDKKPYPANNTDGQCDAHGDSLVQFDDRSKAVTRFCAALCAVMHHGL